MKARKQKQHQDKVLDVITRLLFSELEKGNFPGTVVVAADVQPYLLAELKHDFSNNPKTQVTLTPEGALYRGLIVAFDPKLPDSQILLIETHKPKGVIN